MKNKLTKKNAVELHESKCIEALDQDFCNNEVEVLCVFQHTTDRTYRQRHRLKFGQRLLLFLFDNCASYISLLSDRLYENSEDKI